MAKEHEQEEEVARLSHCQTTTVPLFIGKRSHCRRNLLPSRVGLDVELLLSLELMVFGAYGWGIGNEVLPCGIDSLGGGVDSLDLKQSNVRSLYPASRFCSRWNRFVFEQWVLNDFLNRFAFNANRLG
ncbi:hypothetical protein PIB30_022114 [Stylosanthes scabra]|uniref:Uncharacterized protein n=1 Tax=Stylosanthes scabra TaxID=79078 RepID=A0ABU6T8R1_9FABA|nr:hypothetical protein [Stylosanthes scabra]